MTITAESPFLVTRDRISRDAFARLLREQAALGVIAERDPGQYYDANQRIQTPDGRHLDALLLGQQFVALSTLTLAVVQRVMLGRRHQLEILQSVIGLVSVDVVHMLVTSQRAPDVLFHHISVLKYLLSIDGLPEIPAASIGDSTAPLRMCFTAHHPLRHMLACARAKSRRLVLETVLVNFKDGAANLARYWDPRLPSLLCASSAVLGYDGRTLRPKHRIGPLLFHVIAASHIAFSWLNIVMYKPILLQRRSA